MSVKQLIITGERGFAVRCLLVSVVLLGLFWSVSAQEILWIRQFGTADHDNALAMTLDVRGHIYVTGTTWGALPQQIHQGKSDVYLAKHDIQGNPLWVRQFGTPGWDYAGGVAVDRQGYIYVVGRSGDRGIYDGLLMKFNPEGEILWADQFDLRAFDEPQGVGVDAQGNVYVTGDHLLGDPPPSSGPPTPESAFLRKYDSEGKLLWARGFAAHKALAMALDAAGNVYIAGSLRPRRDQGQLAYVIKFDSQGNELWNRQFGPREGSKANALTVDAAGNVYVVGWTFGEFEGQSRVGSRDAFLRKYSADGAERWTQQFGSLFREEASASGVAVDGQGNVSVVGEVQGTMPGQSRTGLVDSFVRVYDANGGELWTLQYGARGTDAITTTNDVAVDGAGSVYIAGSVKGTLPEQTNLGDWDAYLLKLR